MFKSCFLWGATNHMADKWNRKQNQWCKDYFNVDLSRLFLLFLSHLFVASVDTHIKQDSNNDISVNEKWDFSHHFGTFLKTFLQSDRKETFWPRRSKAVPSFFSPFYCGRCKNSFIGMKTLCSWCHLTFCFSNILNINLLSVIALSSPFAWFNYNNVSSIHRYRRPQRSKITSMLEIKHWQCQAILILAAENVTVIKHLCLYSGDQ